MQRIQTVPFLGNIYLCDRRSIRRDITITSTKLSRAEAMRKALGEMESLRKKTGHYAALHELHGLYDGNEEKAYCSPGTTTGRMHTTSHEKFHDMVNAAGLDEKSGYPPVEEPAAYAYEIMSTWKKTELAEHNRYARLARHSVRFLFALDTPGHEKMRLESMMQLCRIKPEALAGDDIAIAINSALDFLFYLECLALLKRWGLREGEKMLLEAVGISDTEGADAGRRFLLGSLTAKTQERINASYGIDLHGFMFRSLHAPDIRYDDWEW